VVKVGINVHKTRGQLLTLNISNRHFAMIKN